MAGLKFGTRPDNSAEGVAERMTDTTQVEQAAEPAPQFGEQLNLSGGQERLVLQPQNDEPILFTCHPMRTFRIGHDWRFVDGQMRVPDEETARRFEMALRDQPAYLQHQVRRIDRASAEEAFQQLVRGKRIQGFDTTANSFGLSGEQQV